MARRFSDVFSDAGRRNSTQAGGFVISTSKVVMRAVIVAVWAAASISAARRRTGPATTRTINIGG